MATLSQKQARLESLIAIRDSGLSALRQGDKSNEFRSVDDLNKLISDLEAEIAAASTTTQRVRSIRVLTRDGW